MKRISAVLLLILFCFIACNNNDGVDPVLEDYDAMIWIPAGTFTIGTIDPTDAAGCISSSPPRQVILTEGFYMGKYEITQMFYQEVMGYNPSQFASVNSANFPVTNVSWYNAVEFCNKLSELRGLEPAYNIDKENPDSNNQLNTDRLKWTVTLISGADGYRLPTEAQWEYACRAGTTTRFNTGDSITADQANYNGTEPARAGSFAPNAWGLHDMHGNVWEWCWDWVTYGGDNYYVDALDPDTDPTGLISGNRRVVRGGAWNRGENRLLSAYRERTRPYSIEHNDLGFRVIRP